MPSVNECCSLASHAPASPASAPQSSTPAVLIRGTESPSAALAAGRSPVARRRRPNGVRKTSQVASGTNSSANSTSGVASSSPSPGRRRSTPIGRSGSPTTRGELEEEWNTVTSTNRVSPAASRLMPMPLVIWSARNATVTSTWSPAVATPAATAHKSASHGSCRNHAPST